MAFKAACFLSLHAFFGLALAVQKRDNNSQSISSLADVPDSSGGFTVTTNLNLSNPVNAGDKVYNADGTYNVTTGYVSYVMCNNTQASQLIQAVNDAVSLAVDYTQHRRIEERSTLQKAALAYPGLGIGDWWNNRYVILSCKDIETFCSETVFAYYGGQKQYLYPLIVLFPNWFALPSHRGLWNYMKENKRYRNNVSNLRSKASVMLHEWLHVGWGSAVICSQGCDDQVIEVGWPKAPEQEKVYGSGLGKLLAEIEPQGLELASKSNDNYVYYTLANLIYKNFGSYPQYPRAWLRYLSKAENNAREQYDNDRSLNGQYVNISVSGDAVVSDPTQSVIPAIPSALIPASDYPAAYRSILSLNEGDDLSFTTSTFSPSSSTTFATATSSSPAPHSSTPVIAQPSLALIIYRRDAVENSRFTQVRTSWALEYDTTPNILEFSTCEGMTPDYEQEYPRYEGGVTTDYPINLGPFNPHNLENCVYNGTSGVVGRLKCSDGVDIECSIPSGENTVQSCGVDTDTAIVYAEW